MHILILGGTQFVGKHITEKAIANGHEVTLFNRGKTKSEKIPNVTYLNGDRDGNLDALKNKKFDVVIDVCGYTPRVVRQSAELLNENCDHYIFISTISVYDYKNGEKIDIDSPLVQLEDETVEEITAETYGGLKVLCEDVILDVYPENSTIIRPGYIVGPDDHTDRFGYWIKRISESDKVLIPENHDQPWQYIDTRDLAEFTILLAERKQSGIYNAVGPGEKVTVGSTFELMKTIFNSDTQFVEASEKFIEENDISVREFPMTTSPKDTAHYNFMEIDIRPSVLAGLKHRPIEETIKDSFVYIKSLPSDYEYTAGMKKEREEELIKKIITE
ncbi:MAG: NAD-dependent epimerase/dehydratase family protein [Calditrichaeota bacterium]|nr:MAG: NAD-dependent epimerase/dehydratase family protein [Calditrichota bacterium]